MQALRQDGRSSEPLHDWKPSERELELMQTVFLRGKLGIVEERLERLNEILESRWQALADQLSPQEIVEVELPELCDGCGRRFRNKHALVKHQDWEQRKGEQNGISETAAAA